MFNGFTLYVSFPHVLSQTGPSIPTAAWLKQMNRDGL